jgi:hypothetical protein
LTETLEPRNGPAGASDISRTSRLYALRWGMIEERGYQEADFPEPDWTWLASEERVIAFGD